MQAIIPHNRVALNAGNLSAFPTNVTRKRAGAGQQGIHGSSFPVIAFMPFV